MTPVITVDSGGGYSEEVMVLRVPVRLPDVGHLPMGFFYEQETGLLEAIPLTDFGGGRITLATRHFSDIVVVQVDINDLPSTIDTGFRPRVDDWHFPNDGSYVSPIGHCAGQTLTAMWYFARKVREGGPNLYGLHDNGTPGLWEDDVLAYRLASLVQVDIDWDVQAKSYTQGLREWIDTPNVDDTNTWNQIRAAMYVTGQPQLIGVRNSKEKRGHALIAYKVSENRLYVADPNFPGQSDRYIPIGRPWGAPTIQLFSPYRSGDSARAIERGSQTEYDEVHFYGQTALVNWDMLGDRWLEFEQGSVGAGRFPPYRLMYLDADGQQRALRDGLVVSQQSLFVEVAGQDGGEPPFIPNVNVYLDGKWQKQAQFGLEVAPGLNSLGIAVYGQMEVSKDRFEDRWIGFDWILVTYLPSAIPISTPSPTPPPPTQTPIPIDAPAAEPLIAFSSSVSPQIRVMQPDGSDMTGLTSITNLLVYDPKWSHDGSRIAFKAGVRDGAWQVFLMNTDGSGLSSLTSGFAAIGTTEWSPDGSRIAFSALSDYLYGNYDVYVINTDGTGLTNLTDDTSTGGSGPSWSPDGTRIAFSSGRDGDKSETGFTLSEIYVMNADGSQQTNLTNNPTLNDYTAAWSPDGATIAFTGYNYETHNGGVYSMNADGSGRTRLTSDSVDASYPAWSPDGSRVAFKGRSDDRSDIYVVNADGSEETRLTSDPAMDLSPTWSRDGLKIAFSSDRSGRDQVYVINADGSGGLTRLTTDPGASYREPAWQPSLRAVPTPTPTPTQTPTATPTPAAGEAQETALRHFQTWRTLGGVRAFEAPKTWTIQVPAGFTKFEVGNYDVNKPTEVNRYMGWNGYLKVNGQFAWEFKSFTGGVGRIKDHTIGQEVAETTGRGLWLDITSMVQAGSNTITYYHYTGGDGIGVKTRLVE
jgi:TolB protein